MTTPRTDKMLEENGIRCACSDKPVELCRTLERELTSALVRESFIRSEFVRFARHLPNCTYRPGSNENECNCGTFKCLTETPGNLLTSALERERRLREAFLKITDLTAFSPHVVSRRVYEVAAKALSTPAPDHFRDAAKMVPWEVVREYLNALAEYNSNVAMNEGRPSRQVLERYNKAYAAFQSFAPKEGE